MWILGLTMTTTSSKVSKTIHVKVPECTLRDPRSNQHIKTNVVPEPNRVYNFCLSLIGETDRRKYLGTEIAIARTSVPTVSKILRRIRKWKTKDENSIQNSSPEFQEVLFGLSFVAQIKGELGLKVAEALLCPESIDRFGVLCFGESRDMVNSVDLLYLNSDTAKNLDWQWLVRDSSGSHFLNYWIEYNSSPVDSFSLNYSLVSGDENPPDNAWTVISDSKTSPCPTVQGSLQWKLDRDPLHNAGIVGLAMAVKQFNQKFQGSYDVTITDKTLEIKGKKLSLDELDKKLHEFIYTIDNDGIIDMAYPLSDSPQGKLFKQCVHDVLCFSFLQHNSCKKMGEKVNNQVRIGEKMVVSAPYRKILSYKYQNSFLTNCQWDEHACLTGVDYPGAVVRHALNPRTCVKTTVPSALALGFAPIACEYRKVKGQNGYGYAVVVPYYTDIKLSVKHLLTPDSWRHQHKDLIVGSSEDAAFEFLMSSSMKTIRKAMGIKGCSVFYYGSVAWNGQQKVLRDELVLDLDLDLDMEKYQNNVELAYEHLSNKYIKDEEGQAFVSVNPIRSFLIQNVHKHRFILHGLSDRLDVLEKLKYFSLEVMKVVTPMLDDDLNSFVTELQQALFGFRLARWDEMKSRGILFDYDSVTTHLMSQMRRIKNLDQFVLFISKHPDMQCIWKYIPKESSLKWWGQLCLEDLWKKYEATILFGIASYSKSRFFHDLEQYRLSNGLEKRDDDEDSCDESLDYEYEDE